MSTTSMSTLQAKVAAELGHKHPFPNPARPWWRWACEQCTPDLNAKLHTKDVPGHRSREKCAWCLAWHPYATGRLARHLDTGELCRGSGLTANVAHRMMEAARDGHTVPWVLAGIIAKPTRDIEPPPSPAPWYGSRMLINALREARLETRLSQERVAIAIGMSQDSVNNWEMFNRSPLLKNIIPWAAMVGRKLILHDPGQPDIQIVSEIQFCALLASIRIRNRVALQELATTLNLAPSNMFRKENAVHSPRLESAVNWAEALGCDLEIHDAS